MHTTKAELRCQGAAAVATREQQLSAADIYTATSCSTKPCAGIARNAAASQQQASSAIYSFGDRTASSSCQRPATAMP